MIQKIKLHNYVYGFAFTLIEFLLIILVLGSFMIYYFTQSRFLHAMITLGICLNALMFVLYAANSLIKKEKDLGIIKFFNKKARDETYKAHPTLHKDTQLLSVLMVVPFLLILFCCIDIVKETHAV